MTGIAWLVLALAVGAIVYWIGEAVYLLCKTWTEDD